MRKLGSIARLLVLPAAHPSSRLLLPCSHRPVTAVADCLLSQNYQIRQRPRPAAPAAAPAAPQPPRQHFAVKQQHGKLGMSIPQQWQPRADAAGGSAEPFAPPQYRGTAGAEGAGDMPAGVQEQQATGMHIDQEEI